VDLNCLCYSLSWVIDRTYIITPLAAPSTPKQSCISLTFLSLHRIIETVDQPKLHISLLNMATLSLTDLLSEIPLIMEFSNSFADMTSLARTSRAFHDLWTRYPTSIVCDFLRNTKVYSTEARQLAAYQVSIIARLKPSEFQQRPKDYILPIARQLVVNQKIVDATSGVHIKWMRINIDDGNRYLWTESFFKETYYRIWLLCIIHYIRRHRTVGLNFNFRHPIPEICNFSFTIPKLSSLSHTNLLATTYLANTLDQVSWLRPHALIPVKAFLGRRPASYFGNCLRDIITCRELIVRLKLRAISEATAQLVGENDPMAPVTLLETLQGYEDAWGRWHAEFD
jgi:hypothetical protein